MDPFSEIILLLKPHAIVSKPIEGAGNWGVRYAEYGDPGYALVLAGECHLAVKGGVSLQLRQGDFVLFPSTPAFTLSSHKEVTCVDVPPTNEAVRHGNPDGEADFRMLGGAFKVDRPNAALLVDLLPAMIHVNAETEQSSRLARLIHLIQEENTTDWPGHDVILQRLLEIVLIESLRQQTGDGIGTSAGLLAAMRHPQIAKALQAVHANVETGWTVAELGRLAGMSRSVFAAKFQKIVGCAPIEYVTRWRMALAQEALANGQIRLERLAEKIGYESASAFSTAFRKRFGCAPGTFAKRQKATQASA